MTVSVGSVSVRVVPDARDFDKRLKADLGRTPDVQVPVNADTTKARAEVDRFTADTRVKATAASRKTGEDSGGALAQGMRLSLLRNSPLIAAGVAAGLTAGAPVAIAGATALFGGIAAVALKSNEQLKAAATTTGNDIKSAFMLTTEQVVPAFSQALHRIGTAVIGLEPELKQAFGALAAPIDSLTTGIIAMTRNAMPGLVSAVQSAAPVFAGLASLLSEIGTGIGQFFQILSEHSGAAGQAFAAIGQILGELLPILGQLLGTGVELASNVLPPLAAVLGVVAKTLDAIAPVLPAIVTGLAGFAVVKSLTGPLELLSAKLQTVAADGGRMTTALAGKGAGAVVNLGGALPVLGFALAGVGAAFEQQAQQVEAWSKALLDGGKAAEQARAQIAQLDSVEKKLNSGFVGVIGHLTGYGTALDAVAGSGKQATQAAKDYYNSLSPLGKAQQDVTVAQNNYLAAVEKWGPASGQAAGASVTYRDAQQHLADVQGVLKAATDGVSVAAETNAQRLQGIADKASAASGQINVLKGALDALTGTQVSEMQAQAQVTQAVIAATSSLKGMHGALVNANGQINLNTQAGAAAFQSLTNLAGADNTYIATLEQHGATTEQVTKKDAALRDQFVHTAEQMGFTAGQAKNLADQIYGIPAKRNVEITADTSPAAGSLNALVGKFQQINFGNTLHARAFADGGFTGPGGKYDPAGIVHKGEIVWSQSDIAKAGGVARVESARLAGLPGYADGGLVGGSSLMRYLVELTQQGASSFTRALQGVLAAMGFGGGSSSIPVGRSAIAAQVQALAAQRGWGSGSEWQALVNVINRESGFNPNAANPTSSARGLFQKMTSVNGPVESTVTGQTNWGLNYIAGRYGDPIRAWQHELSAGWYDQGGLLNPGYQLVYNGTGGPELVAPPQTFKQVVADAADSGGSGPVEVHVFVGNQEIKDIARVEVNGRLQDMYRKKAFR